MSWYAIKTGRRRTLVEVLGGGVHHLKRNKFEATGLEAGDDVTNKAALDTIRLFCSDR
jgi:hypothetical protein